MKLKFLWSAILALGLFAAGCSKDNSGKTPQGEPSFAQLTIKASDLPKTRNAVENGEPPTGEESTIDYVNGLKVYVFSEAGERVYTSAVEVGGVLTLSDNNDGSYTTDPFVIPAGQMYFYVFVNDVGGKIVAPTATTTMDEFKRQNFTVSFSGGAGSENTGLDIAVDHKFLIGSLWRQTTYVAAGGTALTPVPIDLTIGRLVSKICLMDEPLTSTTLQGAFSATTYRMGTLAKYMYTAGVIEGDVRPMVAPNVMVYSAVHDAPYEIIPPGGVFNDYHFVQYTGYKAPGAYFYATENTTARSSGTHEQFYGNTTYIQIETTYTPVPEELCDPETNSVGATLDASGDFWAANDGGITRMYYANPTGKVTGIADVVYYQGGVMYYKFPVFDPLEVDAVMSNRVLRNHYYEFTVSNIKELGVPEDEVKPEEPIAEKTTVDITVRVRNWDKVTADKVEL